MGLLIATFALSRELTLWNAVTVVTELTLYNNTTKIICKYMDLEITELRNNTELIRNNTELTTNAEFDS